jgi:hypothetical protein
MKLNGHLAAKKEAVRGWDILSAGFGVTGLFLIGSCLVQPKAKINAIRLPVAVIVLACSCAAERLRESDLLSLNKAVEFDKGIQSEKIRKDTLIEATIEDLEVEELAYRRVPQDRWADLAERTGIAPPNLDARSAIQSNPIAASTSTQTIEPPVQTAIPDPEIDPCHGGYDPEGDSQDSQDCIVFAADVESWFSEKGDLVPDSLITEWRENPGIAIKVEGGQASIVRSEN